MLGSHGKQIDDPLTIIFTSGSTGVPKGVVLTYGNIASNVDGIDASIRLNDRDVVLGILPLFHSFGYTVTMWAAMTLPSSVVFHSAHWMLAKLASWQSSTKRRTLGHAHIPAKLHSARRAASVQDAGCHRAGRRKDAHRSG